MLFSLILPAILLVFVFFRGIITGDTDHPYWQVSATLMAMIVAAVCVVIIVAT